jgi:hypothetical protein
MTGISMTGISMTGIEPNWPALALFAATFATGCLSFLTLAGMFPASVRPRSVSGVAGNALILLNVALLLALLPGIALFAHQTLRWTSAVIFGGLIFLFAPTVFQIVPIDWRDSCGGLVILGVVQIASLAMLLSPLQKFLPR